MTSEVEQQMPIFSGRDLTAALAKAGEHHDCPPDQLKAEYVRGHGRGEVQIQVIEQSQGGVEDLYQEEVGVVVDVIKELMSSLNLHCEISTELNGHRLWVNLVGEEAEMFLEHRGELLNDLHFLVTRYFRSKFPNSILELKCDVNQYRQKREAHIEAVSREAAATLKEPGDEVALKPMNSYERRVVHLIFKEDPTIETQSVGEGQLKSVKLVYRGDPPDSSAE